MDRFLRAVSRLPALTLRHEGLLWLLVAGGLALAVLVLYPRLALRFSFRELFEPGHPARDAYDRYQWAFDLGPRAIVYFHGPGVFGPAFLDEVAGFEARVRRLPGTRSVLSAVDLLEPAASGEHLTLRRVLRPEVAADPERLSAALAASLPRWQGLLFDRALTVYAVSITPPADDQDPFAMRAWLAALRDEAVASAARTGVGFHLGGDFFVHQEVRRVAIENQLRLTRVSALLQLGLVWLMFGSFRAALMTLVLLGLAIAFAFAGMAVLGIPVNFMSASFAVMVLTIGTSDVIHMLGRFATLRRRHGPRGAALRAVRRSGLPVFLNTVTTVGCVLVGALTPLGVVRQFSLSLAVGCVSAWAVTVLLAPALFARSGVVEGRGLYFRLHDLIVARLPGAGIRVMRSPLVLPLSAGLCLAALVGTAGQTINSNWYRYFPEGMPVADTLAFVEAKGLPVSLVDLTVPTGLDLDAALVHPALGRDLDRLAGILAGLPGVVRVFTLREQQREIEERIGAVALPPTLTPLWAEARRDALRRQYRAIGLFDPWMSPRTRDTRIVATTTLEDSRGFVALEAALVAALASTRFEHLDPGQVRIAGQMIYWSAIMDSIPKSFLASLGGSILVVVLCFWWVSGSLSLALLALIPNVVPLFAMFAISRLAGITLNENVCLITALAEGIAVDDTIHFLFHYAGSRRAGGDARQAVLHTFFEAGASIVVTALLFATGFAVCLLADVTPIRQMGFCLVTSVVVAAAAELVLIPALLLRGEPREP